MRTAIYIGLFLIALSLGGLPEMEYKHKYFICWIGVMFFAMDMVELIYKLKKQ